MEPTGPHPALPQLRLDDLLTELQARLQTVLATRDRVYIDPGEQRGRRP